MIIPSDIMEDLLSWRIDVVKVVFCGNVKFQRSGD